MGMSRILTKKLIFILSITLMFLLSSLYDGRLVIVFIVICLFLLVNMLLRKHINKEGFTFYMNEKGADYLIIGDQAEIPNISLDNAYVLRYMSPDRTLISSFEIAKRLYSILSKQGTLIFVVRREKLNDMSFSLFDYAFFHPVQLKILNIGYLKYFNFFPLVFAPRKVLGSFFSSPRKTEEASNNIFYQNDLCQYIVKFWEERDVKFKLFIIK